MKSILSVCVPLVIATSSIVMLSGCGSGTNSTSTGTTPTIPTTPPTTVDSVLVSGKVRAGSTPIVGASVQVYSAGTTGNGTGAKSLLSVPVTTDSTGAFAVTSGLSCSSAEPMYYLVARGGQIGSSAANAAIALTAAVGDCSKLSTSTTTAFTVNEVTTVAFTWSLSQFLAQGAFVGAASTNATGLANAFATAANLADTSTGKSPGALFPANGRSPVAKINTLANLLNNCIVVPSSCGALFSATTVSGTSAPTNTLDAAFQLARNPGKNVGVLYTQSVSGKAFAPILAAAPSDWTLSIGFTGGGMSAPTGIGVDSKGNIWVASYTGVASKFTPTGLPVFASGITGSGLQTSYGLAVDSSDNVWIPNEDSPRTVNTGFGSVTVLNSNGQPLSGSTGYTAGGLSYPISLAIDPNGAVWVVNYHNSSLTKLSNSGAVLSGSAGYGAPSLAFIVAIAIDANHNAWIGNQNDLTVTRVSSDGSQSLAVACCNGPQGVAIDQRGNIWATNFYGDSVSQFASNGTIISSGYTGGGLSRPQGIAIDGAGTVWALSLRSTSSAASPTLTQLAGSGAASPGAILSPSAGWLADANLLQPYSLAIDASGNIWLTNFVNDAQYTNSNTITEVIGLASPVKTPVIGPAQAP